MKHDMGKVGFLKHLVLTLPLLGVATNRADASVADRVAYIDDTAIQTSSEWVGGKHADRSGQLFVSAMVAAHNNTRREVGLDGLEWDPALAADAGAYAAEIAQSRRFEHADEFARRGQGENLWMGTRSAYSYKEMIGTWSDEGKDFRPGRFPQVSATGSWHDIGHYTQMVWTRTRRVGCAIASNKTDDFLVCRYFPAGNMAGEDMTGHAKTRMASLANASAR